MSEQDAQALLQRVARLENELASKNNLVDQLKEEQFDRSGLDLSRQDMSNWTLKVGLAVKPLVSLLEKALLSASFIQMDETPVQVLSEPGRIDTSKSYMWLARGWSQTRSTARPCDRGGPPGKPVVLYEYQPSRAAKHPASFLAEYSGYLQTDGYEAYAKAIEGKRIVHVGCWAHARRKFDEAAKASNQTGTAHAGLAKIRKL